MRRVLLAQSAYYLGTGIWPIVHLPSFESVTGPKLEGWLVKTVGATVAAIGASLGAAVANDRIEPETRLLAAGSAAGLGLIDSYYAAKRRISLVYLLDAAAQAWFVSALARSRTHD
jgi:hypothetical protein